MFLWRTNRDKLGTVVVPIPIRQLLTFLSLIGS